MAITAAAVGEVRQATGNDNWGGFFIAGASGTDRSQANAAFVVIDNSTITTSITTNVITFTGGYTPTAADIGNVVQMLTGTNVTAGFYNITAQTSTTWTVNGNVVTSGTTTNATGNMGGALATLTKLSGAMLASNKAYGTGNFISTATTTFAQAVANTSAAAPPTRLIGYGSTRGDTTHLTVTLSTNTGLTGLKATGNAFFFEQCDVNGSSLGTSSGITTFTSGFVIRCKVTNCTTAGITLGTSASAVECEATGNSGANGAITGSGNTTGLVTRCFVHDNTSLGINLGSGFACTYNIVCNNSGASSDGIFFSSVTSILNNTVHNNGRDGLRGATSQLGMTIRNNLLTSNGGFGLNLDNAAALPAAYQYDGNAYYSNTSGARNNADSTAGIYGVNPYTNTMDVTLSGSPYVGPTTGTSANFALNNTAGAGAACRASGTPGTWPGNTGTTGFLDMGAVQHADTSGSILVAQGLDGGMNG